MFIDALSAVSIREHSGLMDRSIAAFLRFIEKRVGASIIVNGRNFPQDLSLLPALALAKSLRDSGVIREFGRSQAEFSDEPRMYGWYALCNDSKIHRTGGSSMESDQDALYASLAEALERYLWFSKNDYFKLPTIATTDEIVRKGTALSPDRFAGYSSSVGGTLPTQVVRENSRYLWIQGRSLVHHAPVFLPAQIVSPLRGPLTHSDADEPRIRRATTNGLATATTRARAQLYGILELIERDAYMILWLNQLTLPRISLDRLRARDAALDRELLSCERYRLRVHAIRMLTDAPTHAVAVIIEDSSNRAPRFTIGLRAHQSLTTAVKKAITEALRARIGYRSWERAGNTWDSSTPVEEIGHRERLYYWGDPKNAMRLEFLTQGSEEVDSSRPWDDENDAAHFARIVAWCRETQKECISVPLTQSKGNPTDWHIEMTVIPELQPMYLTEASRAWDGKRLKDIPRAFGYAPREEPYREAPHPFS